MRRVGGFTLVELMISLALAGLIVGGALQLHASFNRQSMRQNQIAEMQQTLRVSMLVLERAIRQAGQGISGGAIVEQASGTGGTSCGGAAITHYAFQWSNKNVFADPIVPVTTTGSDGTTTTLDPDWFMVMYADPTPPIYAASDDGQSTTIFNPKSGGIAPDLTGFPDGELFLISYPTGATCKTTGGSSTPCTSLPSCYREVSKGTNFGGASKILQHIAANSVHCYNPSKANDQCAVSASTLRPIIKNISGMATAYRVMTPSDAGNPTPTPKLTMRTAPIGNTDTTVATGYPWQIIAENIEDMQLALVMDDGRVCNHIDDPTQCVPTQAAAVRITLTARSENTIPGVTDGLPRAWEDEVAITTSDNYLRRAVTAEIELRNMGNP